MYALFANTYLLLLYICRFKLLIGQGLHISSPACLETGFETKRDSESAGKVSRAFANHVTFGNRRYERQNSYKTCTATLAHGHALQAAALFSMRMRITLNSMSQTQDGCRPDSGSVKHEMIINSAWDPNSTDPVVLLLRAVCSGFKRRSWQLAAYKCKRDCSAFAQSED